MGLITGKPTTTEYEDLWNRVIRDNASAGNWPMNWGAKDRDSHRASLEHEVDKWKGLHQKTGEDHHNVSENLYQAQTNLKRYVKWNDRREDALKNENQTGTRHLADAVSLEEYIQEALPDIDASEGWVRNRYYNWSPFYIPGFYYPNTDKPSMEFSPDLGDPPMLQGISNLPGHASTSFANALSHAWDTLVSFASAAPVKHEGQWSEHKRALFHLFMASVLAGGSGLLVLASIIDKTNPRYRSWGKAATSVRSLVQSPWRLKGARKTRREDEEAEYSGRNVKTPTARKPRTRKPRTKRSIPSPPPDPDRNPKKRRRTKRMLATKSEDEDAAKEADEADARHQE